jgi:hypothetical protein
MPLLAEIRRQGTKCRLNSGFPAAANSAADVVEKRATGLVPHIFRDVLETAVYKIRCKSFGF